MSSRRKNQESTALADELLGSRKKLQCTLQSHHSEVFVTSNGQLVMGQLFFRSWRPLSRRLPQGWQIRAIGPSMRKLLKHISKKRVKHVASIPSSIQVQRGIEFHKASFSRNGAQNSIQHEKVLESLKGPLGPLYPKGKHIEVPPHAKAWSARNL